MKEEDRRREEEERRREQLFRAIEQLIYTAYLQALSLPAVRRAIEQKKDDFFFESNHTANRQVERVLGAMADRLNGLLLNGIRREWEFSNEVLEARVEAQLDPSTRDRMLRDRLRIDATQRSRLASADAFVREKQRDGLNLSGRVWNLAGNAKKEIEVILQNAIKEGRRGTEIAKDLRRFLIEPNKLFRRVRNKETGALELSAAAKAYHPGQGVYRSSYKNALRMARTELKAAQCEAAWQSAQTNPLIVGWEIRLSNNHTTLRDGKPCPFHDMCDELQGVYPKAFRFRGWHPHCRCEMLPIIARPSDRKELYRRIFKGDAKERASWSPRAVEEVPQVFTDWVEKNRARARGWRTVPRFITDNPAYIVGEYGRPKPRPVEVPPGFLDFEDPRFDKEGRERVQGMLSKLQTPTGAPAFVAFEPFSPIIVRKLSELTSRRERQKLLKAIIDDKAFAELSRTGEYRTVSHPGHKWGGSRAVTLEMAEDVNRAGADVAFLPEYKEAISADAITQINGQYCIADFKHCSSTNVNTLSKELIDGFSQAGNIVLKVTKMDSGQLRSAIEYVKRNGNGYNGMKIINKYGKTLDLSQKDIKTGRYINKIRGFL